MGATGEDVIEIVKCLDDIPDLTNKIMKIIEDLKNLKPTDFNKFIQIIVDMITCFQNICGDVIPCVDSSSEVYKIIKQILALTPADILRKVETNILMHGPQIFSDIVSAINNFKAQKYEIFGKNVGDIIVQILFDHPKEEWFTPDDLKKLLQGLLEGLRFPNIDALMKCFDKMQDV